MSHKYVFLKEVCEKASSNIAQKDLAECDGIYPIYGASGYIKSVDFFQQAKDYIAIVKDGAGIGRAMKLPAKSSVIGTMQYVLPKDNINISYLYYAICSMHLEKYFSGATIPHIYFRDYQNEQLPLPSLEEQAKIANVFGRIDYFIKKEKEQLINLDKLVKSRFIELFGDVEESSKRWNTVYLEKVIQSIESGWSGNGIQRDKLEGEIAVLKVSAVTKGFFIPSECKVLEDQKNIKKYIYPHKDDLLFSRANTKEMVGATVIISKDFPELILPDKLWRIRFNELANIYFIKYVLSSRSIRNKLSSEATGTSGSMYNISMQKLKQLAIPLPPTDLQNNFAAFVSKIDKSKLAIQQSLDELETLKKSLMQQYFG